MAARDGRRVLGRTVDILVYDAHAGLDADALGAAAGSLRGGGLLVLLTPAWAEWPTRPDPLLGRLIPAGHGRDEAGQRFLRRLMAELEQDPSVTLWTPEQPPPALEPTPPAAPGGAYAYGCLSADQKTAVEAVMHVVTGHRRRPAVLTADRGRGKSAALGIAVGELLRQRRVQRVVVTAPTIHAAEGLLDHAAERCGGERVERRRLRCHGAEVVYREPEALRERPESGDLLAVDEAAGLPVDLLAQLLEHAGRIAFATTVHGYEGSGRGFDLRFRAILDAETPGWQAVRLEAPIRWDRNDPLEAWLGRVLCLDAEPATLEDGGGSAAEIVPVTQDALAQEERRLRQAFGLLVAAHYRTRPFDLHQLLDGPRRHLFLAEEAGAVVGVVVAAEEGGLDPETAHEVWAERRRPHGHLLPQALATHAGIEMAPTGRALRIQRIAVHPRRRGHGIGAALVAAVTERARGAGCALVGTSFGATPGLIGFWRACGMHAVAVGARRDAASGEHSALMARGLDEQGVAWVRQAGFRLGAGAPALLGEPLARMEPQVVLAVLRAAQGAEPPVLSDWQRQELVGFAHSLRGYAAALPALWVLAEVVLMDPHGSRGRMAHCEAAFIGKVLQHRPWADTAQRLGVPGRRPALAALRQAVADSLPE
nr:GNAT family N-acetyltransferase [Halorhodospira halophila]